MSETVQTFILAGHILVGILLVTIILVQRGKGSDAGMAFGGGASGTVFGATGSGTFLTKTTKWLAVSFFCTSLALAYVHNNKTAPTSILDTVEDVQQEGEISPLAAPLPESAGGATNIESAPKLEITSPDGVTVTALPGTADVSEAVDSVADSVTGAASEIKSDGADLVDGAVETLETLKEEVAQDKPEG